MSRHLMFSRLSPPQYARASLQFTGWPHGLNASVRATQLKATELAECINFYPHNQAGHMRTRDPVVKYSNSATTSNAAVATFRECPIGGTSYELLVDANYVLYYLDGSLDPQTIGTLEGACEIVPYNGVAVLLDGSYIKYLDGVSAIKIAYDDGTGSSGYQFNNLAGDDDTTLALGNGTNTRIAVKFTSQAWTAGYTIPPTTGTFELSAQGTPHASAITARLRKVSDDSILAAKELMADASELTAVSEQVSVTFASTDITTQMSPSVAYYMSLEHTGGDGANYVKVHCTTVASGGTAYAYAGSWAADTTKTPIAGLRPGRPPKAAFGCVKTSRLFAGGDPDNPGYVWFSNLHHLDWSTTDGGGYVGAVDANANTYPVGAIDTVFDDLLVFGQQDHPYICRLTGDTPSAYALPVLFQKVWASHRTLTSIVNDLWAFSYDGVFPVTGVQEYGDLRVGRVGDPVLPTIQSHWVASTAVAAFNAADGHIWLSLPTYHRVLVARAKLPILAPDSQASYYPWTEFEICRDQLVRSAYKWTWSTGHANEFYLQAAAGGDPGLAEPDFITVDGTLYTQGTVGSLSNGSWGWGDNDALGYDTVYIKLMTSSYSEQIDPDDSGLDIRVLMVPGCYDYHGDTFFMGGSDGFIYKLDPTGYRDMSAYQILPRLKTNYVSLPFRHVNFEDFQIQASSLTGAALSVGIYRDGAELERFHSLDVSLLVSDALTLGDALMALEDATFPLGPSANATLWQRMINFNARSVQYSIYGVTLQGQPLYVDGLIWQYRYLSA